MIRICLPFIAFMLHLSCSFEPGTLGDSATYSTIGCEEGEVIAYLDSISQLERFQVPNESSGKVEFWKNGGFDFLTYRVLRSDDHLFMISFNSELDQLSVRALIKMTSSSSDWLYATDFTENQIELAENAMKTFMLSSYC